MTSPINNINRSSSDAVSSSNGKTRARTADDAATPASKPATGDTVSLSEEASQVLELQKQLNDVPEVDADKVEAIKQAIAKGQYPLDPERIAQNMTNLEKALTDS